VLDPGGRDRQDQDDPRHARAKAWWVSRRHGRLLWFLLSGFH
jgi:hypothetical protein